MLINDLFFYSGKSKISAVLNLPDEQSNKNPCVIFMHGYASNKNEFGGFDKLAELFCKNMIAVFRFDFRGCGSSISINKKGEMLCVSEWVFDVCNAFESVSRNKSIDDKNIALLGVSMGGATVLSSLKYLRKARAAAVLSPVNRGLSWLKNLWLENKNLQEWKNFLKTVLEKNGRKLNGNENEFINIDDLLAFNNKDKNMWKELLSNFSYVCDKASYSSAYEIIRYLNSSREIKAFKNTPVLFVHGDNDSAVPFTGTQELYEKYNGEKELMILKNKSHALLLEEDSNIYMENIVGWFKKYLFK